MSRTFLIDQYIQSRVHGQKRRCHLPVGRYCRPSGTNQNWPKSPIIGIFKRRFVSAFWIEQTPRFRLRRSFIKAAARQPRECAAAMAGKKRSSTDVRSFTWLSYFRQIAQKRLTRLGNMVGQKFRCQIYISSSAGSKNLAVLPVIHSSPT